MIAVKAVLCYAPREGISKRSRCDSKINIWGKGTSEREIGGWPKLNRAKFSSMSQSARRLPRRSETGEPQDV